MIPEIEYVELEGLGHCVHEERFVAIAVEFVRRVLGDEKS